MHQAHEFGAPCQIGVKLVLNVTDARDELAGRVVTVDARQRRVDIEIAAVGRSLKNAFGRIFEDAAEAALGLLQRLRREPALGYILNESFKRNDITVVVVDADAALPYPFDRTVTALDPVFDEKAAFLGKRRVDLVAHARAVFRMLDLFVRNLVVVQQFRG